MSNTPNIPSALDNLLPAKVIQVAGTTQKFPNTLNFADAGASVTQNPDGTNTLHLSTTKSFTLATAADATAITAGKAVMPDNGAVTLATTDALPDGLTHAGIAITTPSGGRVTVVTQGFVDPAIANVGAGLACAVGTDASANIVRVTDSACVSGLKYVGVCDANGAIYVSPSYATKPSARDLGATADGIANDAAALATIGTVSGTADFDAGETAAASATVTYAGKSLAIRGAHRKLSAIKALTMSMTLLDVSGAPGKVLVLEDMMIDANAKAFLVMVGGSLFDSIEIRRCDFVNLNSEAAAASLGSFSNFTVEDCLFEGNGALVSTGLQISAPVQSMSVRFCRFRGLNTGISISAGSPNAPATQDVTIEGCRFDMMYYSAPYIAGLTNSGGTVSFTSNTLVDSAKTFSLGAFGTTGTFNQYGYIRALTPRHSATATSVARSQLVDTSASFTSYGIVTGEIVRCGSAQALIVSVDDDHHLNLEEWLDVTTMLPAATPSGTYTIYGILLGRAYSASSHTVTLDRVWADLNGSPSTPASGTLYEIPPTPNYPITTSSNARRVRLVGNTVLRSSTDGLSPFGDECEITGNTIRDGQDVGITIDGSVGISGVKGGRHDVHDNLIIRAGSEGIYYGGQYDVCIHHNRIFGWGARSSGVSSPGAGESGIDCNPAGVSSITGGVVDHNVIDGDGLPNAYYGITALDCVDVDFDTNNIHNVISHEYNIIGSSTSNITLRHRNSSIDYTTSGMRGTAPGALSTLYGTGSPLGTVIASPGSTYFDTVNGLAWIKVSGTDATGWQYLSPTQFSPKSIPSGLAMWFRADLGLTLSGSNVTGWADQSGVGDSNLNLTSSATHYPTIVTADSDFNNLPALTFDPSIQPEYLVSGTWAAPSTQACTWMWILKTRVSGIMSVSAGIDSSHNQLMLQNSGSVPDANAGTDLLSVRGSVNEFYSTAQIAIVVYDGVTSAFYLSQTTPSTGDAGAGTQLGVTLGAYYDQSSFPLDGKIAEFARWQRALTAPEIASLNTYAATRYGISIEP